MDTSKLKTYFYQLSAEQRLQFAAKCGTSEGQIKQIISLNRTCNPSLAINFERESGGAIRCDDLCPHVDFEYLRGQASVQQT